MLEKDVSDQTGRQVIFCADDFAITEGVSDAIEELADRGQLSATSAIVTARNWHRCSVRLARLRERIAVGLHLNLTLGSPLGSMGRLAPRGRFPTIGELLRQALCRNISADEIAAETERQIVRFTEVAGEPPDFVDGHQHAHALPGIRRGVLAALNKCFPAGNVLVRDPADKFGAIIRRDVATKKALGIAVLAHGFREACERAGAMTNVGFSGVSNFKPAARYADELPRFFVSPGPRHLVMCHPGFSDAELARLDPVAGRREEEFSAIREASWLGERIWRPQRGAGTIWSPVPERTRASG